MNRTELDQEPLTPSEERDPSIEQIPDELFVSAGINVKFKLSLPDGSHIGYMEVNEDGWCQISQNPSTFDKLIAKGQTYYQLINNSTKYNERWLRGRKVGRHRVGVYRKYLRSPWKFDGTKFISILIDEPLSLFNQSTGRLYTNNGDKYTVLQVEEVVV